MKNQEAWIVCTACLLAIGLIVCAENVLGEKNIPCLSVGINSQVRLKSGGPNMTVVGCRKGSSYTVANVAWTDNLGQPQRHSYATYMLQNVSE